MLRLFATLWTVACQAPGSMGFSKKTYWSGLPFSAPWDIPDPAIKPSSLRSPALVGRFSTTSTTWEAQFEKIHPSIIIHITMSSLCWHFIQESKDPRGSWFFSILILIQSFNLPRIVTEEPQSSGWREQLWSSEWNGESQIQLSVFLKFFMPVFSWLNIKLFRLCQGYLKMLTSLKYLIQNCFQHINAKWE